MKKFLSLFVLCALFAACSSDSDDNDNNRHQVEIDDKLIKSVELYDVTDGVSKPVSVTEIKYDNDRRIAKVKVEESDYNDGKTTAITETIYTYEGRRISYSTMHEESYSVWLNKGIFDLDKGGKVVRGELNEEGKPTVAFSYKYQDGNYIASTTARAKGYNSVSSMDWSSDNIILFEWVEDNSDSKEECKEYERVEYTNFFNDASIDLAGMICFGSEGSKAAAAICGTKEGNFLNIMGRRVKNLPLSMTELSDGYKEIKNFDYKRDRNNRVYEIQVKKVRTYRNEQTDTKEYKYLIVY